jgi:hypothetical protein
LVAIERVETSFRALDRRPVLTTFERPDADLDAALATAGWKQVIELSVMVRRWPLLDEPAPPARCDGSRLTTLRTSRPCAMSCDVASPRTRMRSRS